MNCEHCGADISEGALACPRCGGPAPIPPGEQSGPATGAKAPDAGEPAEVPLAPVEEDFIAMAEETVLEEEAGRPASDFATEVQATKGSNQAAALADQNIPPGAHVMAEQIELDAKLTGGYKGPEAASVAGAGEQTAEDPFGLNITEAAPSVLSREETGRWDLRKVRNIVVMIVALLAAATVATLGIYYGLLKESGSSPGNPRDALNKFFTIVISGDQPNIGDVAIAETKLIGDIEQLLIPYENMGEVYLKKLECNTISMENGQADVEITKLELEIITGKGIESFDMLDMTKPFPVPRVVHLVEQNGKWLVSS